MPKKLWIDESNFINSKCDQSWKGKYIKLMWQENNEKGEKMFIHFNERVVSKNKI
jgi:hypothetical protein